MSNLYAKKSPSSELWNINDGSKCVSRGYFTKEAAEMEIARRNQAATLTPRQLGYYTPKPDRTISIVWGVEDVQEERPDLTDDQAWEVLQRVKRYHDANIGINWDVLRTTADIMFPEELK